MPQLRLFGAQKGPESVHGKAAIKQLVTAPGGSAVAATRPMHELIYGRYQNIIERLRNALKEFMHAPVMEQLVLDGVERASGTSHLTSHLHTSSTLPHHADDHRVFQVAFSTSTACGLVSLGMWPFA